VEPNYLSFDFSHFQKMTAEEITEVEHRVNRMIRKNSSIEEHRSLPMSKAVEMGAMALFGEKYGDAVRVIKFGDTIELCGGTHVQATGQIGIFRLFRESSIAAGIRRIEAFTGEVAERYIDENMDRMKQIAATFEKSKDLVSAVKGMADENSKLSSQVDKFQKNMLGVIAKNLEESVERIGDASLVASKIDVANAGQLKDLAFQCRSRYPRACLVLGAEVDGKAHLAIMLAEGIIKNYELNASHMIREVSKEIQGGGGGQPFFATAGGKNPAGIESAIQKARQLIVDAAEEFHG